MLLIFLIQKTKYTHYSGGAMLEIAIYEDNEIDATVLENFVSNYLNQKLIDFHISVFSTGEALLTDFERGKYQLLFLDIYMDTMTGLEVGKAIREIDLQVEFIFCTSSAEYALESYDILALGYLLKPFDPLKMEQLLDRFIQRSSHLSYHTLTVKCQYEDHMIRIDDIVFIKSDDKVLLYHLENGDTLRCYGKLNELEEQLQFPNFLRCHQRYLINMDYIETVDDDYFTTKSHSHVPIRKHEVRKIKDKYAYYYNNTNKSQ